MFALTEEARLHADSAAQQRRLDNLSVSCIYKGTLVSYYDAYDRYDDERVAELIRRYALIDERMSQYGVDMTVRIAPNIYGESLTYERDLEHMAWSIPYLTRGWGHQWLPVVSRPMPEKVAADLTASGVIPG